MSAHDDAADLLAHWVAPDEEQEVLRAAYVAHLGAHPDAVLRSCFPDHLTAGALVLSADGRQVLLNLHRKARRWFHFGGHVEAGDHTLAGAALREATEESGLEALVLDAEPVQLSRHRVDFCDPRGPVHHLDVRFLARASGAERPRASEESVEVRWFPVDELPTEDPDMLALVRLAGAR